MSYDFRSLTLLWQKVLADAGTWCRTSTERDWITASSRFEAEGFSFFTITLTAFGKELEKALDQGFVGDDQFAGFKRIGGLPRFLGGFLRLVFDAECGAVLDSPSIGAIACLRQLTLMFGKLEVPCSETRNRKAVDGYVQVESELGMRDSRGLPADAGDLRRVFATLYGNLLARVGDRIDHVGPSPRLGKDRGDHLWSPLDGMERQALIPRHGPGATADRLIGNQKFLDLGWTARLERVFSSADYLVPNARYAQERLHGGSTSLTEPGAEVPVKVTLVPKTLKTPRIIAEEPTCMMYAQQALWRCLRDEWKRDNLLSSMVTFQDQEPNKVLAREGSQSGRLATLDLSEASDRVSNELVRYLFSPWSSVADALDATRSRRADVPGVGVIRLSKFASMGSALCFPVETMVFLAIIILSWEQHTATRFRARDVHRVRNKVRVFGDDMIVPVDLVPRVIHNLEAFGFKVNMDKSFWTGKFRESCGGDYYDGEDVSVVRCRKVFPSGRKDAAEVEAMVALRNQFYFAGFWTTCQWLDRRIVKVLPHFPIVETTSVILGRHSFLPYKAEKECSLLHRPLVKGFVSRPVIPRNPLDGVPALLKFFVMRGEEPLEAGHLERSGRPRTVDIKARWSTPY